MKNLKITLALAAACAAFAVVPAHAVVTLDGGIFELDGNIKVDDTGTPKVDWARLFLVSDSAIPTVNPSQPSGFIADPVFVRDFVPGKTSDDSTYTTGSKDTLNIGGGGWQCTKSNNIGDKVDVLNAYATAQVYNVGGKDHVFVYFGMEVASNLGTKDVGFWFLKDRTAGCVAGTHATNFTGNHMDGDLLIVSEYTKGGGVSTIKAYKWIGGAAGYLDTANPVAQGADCRTASSGTICATVNSQPLYHSTDVPWLTQTKGGGGLTSADLDSGEFFEGGIDLTANTLEGCFSRFLADTRSSASPTATLFDYALGEFNLCSFSVGKKCDTGVADNPHVNSGGDLLVTQFDVPIVNGGLSTLYKIRLRENVTFGTGESCTITGITGGNNPTSVPAEGIPIGSSDDVPIADSLNGNTTMHVAVVCNSIANPFLNSVIATANPVEGGTAATDLSADHTVISSKDSTNEACPYTVSPVLDVVKGCSADASHQPPVTFNLATGKATICIDVMLTNKSDEDLKNITVVDDKAGTVVDNKTLASGGNATYTACYSTSTADIATTDPSKITFSDNLTSVSFTGVVSGKTVTLTSPPAISSATCPLCPKCPPCP